MQHHQQCFEDGWRELGWIVLREGIAKLDLICFLASLINCVL
jgi:hypothetical protein